MNRYICITACICLFATTTASGQIVPKIGDNTIINGTLDPNISEIFNRSTVDIAELDIPGAPVKSYAIVWRESITFTPPSHQIFLAVVNELGETIVDKVLIDQAQSIEIGTSGDFEMERFGNPAVAADGEGNFAVVWATAQRSFQSYSPRYSSRIWYQLFKPEPLVGGLPNKWMPQPALLLIPDAEFEPFTGSLNAIPNGPYVDISASFDGRFALVFSDDRNETDGEDPFGTLPSTEDFSIYVSIFDFLSNGATAELVSYPPGARPTLVTNNGEHQAKPRIDVNLNDATSAVTWRNAEGHLKAQVLRDNGQLHGAPFDIVERANSVTKLYHSPDVAIDRDNTLWFSWELNHYRDDENPNAFSRIEMARFDSAGNAIAQDIPVSVGAVNPTTQLIARRSPRIQARDEDRNVVVTWQQAEQTCIAPNPAIFDTSSSCFSGVLPSGATQCIMRISDGFNSDCRTRVRLVPDPDVPESGGSRAIARDYPRDFLGGVNTIVNLSNFSSTRNACFAVEVTDASFDVSTRRIEQSCTGGSCQSCDDQATTSLFASEKAAPLAKPSKASHDTESLVSYKGLANSEYDIMARWFHRDFQRQDATFVDEFLVSDPSVGTQRRPIVAQQDDGDMMVVWQGENDGQEHTISAQRYTSAVEISVNDVGILEGPLPIRATAAFTVSASKPYPNPDPVNNLAPWPVPLVRVKTADDTATFLPPRPDYEQTDTVVMFEPGQPIVQGIDVQVTEDTVFEDDETFLVNLSEVTDAIVVKNQGLGVIIDNDLPEAASIADAQICENGDPAGACTGTLMVSPNDPNPTVQLEVSLNAAQEVDGSIEFRTLDGISDGTFAGAKAGVDYEPVTGELQFLAGVQTGFVTIELLDNAQQELDKKFIVELLAPTDLSLGDTMAEVIIRNDDSCANLPVVTSNTPDPIINLSDEGDTAYLCVTNNDPGNCSWASDLAFIPGQPTDWLSRTDAPGQTPPVEANCAAGATGYIAISADPLLPPTPETMTNPEGGLSRSATLNLFGTEMPNQYTLSQTGGACDPIVSQSTFTYFPGGGEGSFDVELEAPADNPNLCNTVSWVLSLSAGTTPWVNTIRINGENTLAGIGDGTVTFRVNENNNPQPGRNGAILINGSPVAITQEGYFFDHFADATLPLGWYLSSLAWLESGTKLQIDALNGAEWAIADIAFPGCQSCEISASLSTEAFAKGQTILYAWWVDADHHVRLEQDEFLDEWRLVQQTGPGTQTVIKTFEADILTGQSYDVVLGYNGNASNNVTLQIDDTVVCADSSSGQPTCSFAMPVATGTVGFGATGTVSAFDRIKVYPQ